MRAGGWKAGGRCCGSGRALDDDDAARRLNQGGLLTTIQGGFPGRCCCCTWRGGYGGRWGGGRLGGVGSRRDLGDAVACWETTARTVSRGVLRGGGESEVGGGVGCLEVVVEWKEEADDEAERREEKGGLHRQFGVAAIIGGWSICSCLFGGWVPWKGGSPHRSGFRSVVVGQEVVVDGDDDGKGKGRRRESIRCPSPSTAVKRFSSSSASNTGGSPALPSSWPQPQGVPLQPAISCWDRIAQH